MYTEEEAKTKWCHATIARTSVHVDGQPDSFQPRCIGSDCMAWRTGRTTQYGATYRVPPELYREATRPEHEPSLADKISEWGEAQKAAGRVPANNAGAWLYGVATIWRDGETVTGYCGLAGKP